MSSREDEVEEDLPWWIIVDIVILQVEGLGVDSRDEVMKKARCRILVHQWCPLLEQELILVIDAFSIQKSRLAKKEEEVLGQIGEQIITIWTEQVEVAIKIQVKVLYIWEFKVNAHIDLKKI